MYTYFVTSLILFFLTSFFNSVFTIHSLFYVLLIYLSIFFILISFGFDFLALLLIMVYVGGILVLFLFVLFLLDNNRTLNVKNNYLFFSFNFFLKILFFIIIIYFFYYNYIYFKSLDVSFNDLLLLYITSYYNKFNFIDLTILDKQHITSLYFTLYDNILYINGTYIDTYSFKLNFYFLADYYINTFGNNYVYFYTNSFWKLGYFLYIIYFIPLYLVFLLLFISMMGVFSLTFQSSYTSYNFFNFKFFDFKDKKYSAYDFIAWFYFVFTTPFSLNTSLNDFLVFDDYFCLFFIASSLFIFNTFFLLFSKNINIVKLILIFELYFLSIILFLCFFSTIHNNYDGIIFIFFLIGIMSVETILFLSIFVSFKSKKLIFFKKS